MRHKKIDPSLFIDNRNKLTKHLKPNALVILNANDVLPTNGDGFMPFRQNSDLFYLSGIEQEETILLLYPDAPQEEWQELLFIKATNEKLRIWEGQKHTKEIASAISGIVNVHWLDEFLTFFHNLMKQVEYVYVNSNEHPRAVLDVQTRDARFIAWCKQQYPLHKYERLALILQHLRMVKSDVEIDLIRQACNITTQGFKHVLPQITPGIAEYTIEAFFYQRIYQESFEKICV